MLIVTLLLCGAFPGVLPASHLQPSGVPHANGDQQGELETAIKKLRSANDQTQAGIQSIQILTTHGAKGRETVLGMFGDKGVPLHVLEGILGAFRYRNDFGDDVLAALETVLPLRDDMITPIRDFVRKFEAESTILPHLFARLDDPDAAAAPGPLLTIILQLVNTDQQRMVVVEGLVAQLEKNQSGPRRRIIEQALHKSCFHQFEQVPQWRAWLDTFKSAHPTGFSSFDLYLDAKDGTEQRVDAEAQKAIRLLAQNGVLPFEYLGDHRYSVGTRVLAIEQAARVIGDAADRRKRVGERMLECVRKDPSPVVRKSALGVLRDVVRTEESLRAPAAEVLKPILDPTGDLETLALAVEILGACGGDQAGKTLAGIYRHRNIRKNPEAQGVRREVITALVNLKQGHHDLMIEALNNDLSPDIRKDAARSLATIVTALPDKRRAALALAESLKDEADGSVRRTALASIRKIGALTDKAVTDAILVELGRGDRGPEERTEALQVLMTALSSMKDKQRAEFEMVMLGILPQKATQVDDRRACATAMATAKPFPLRLGKGWLLKEADSETRKTLISLMLADTSVPVTSLWEVCQHLDSIGATPEALPLLARIEATLSMGTRTEAEETIREAARWMRVRALSDSGQVNAAEEIIQTHFQEADAGLDAWRANTHVCIKRGNWRGAWTRVSSALKLLGGEGVTESVEQEILADVLLIAGRLPREPAILVPAIGAASRLGAKPSPRVTPKMVERWKREADVRTAVSQLADPDKKSEAEDLLEADPKFAAPWLLAAIAEDAEDKVATLRLRLATLRILLPSLAVPELSPEATVEQLEVARLDALTKLKSLLADPGQ